MRLHPVSSLSPLLLASSVAARSASLYAPLDSSDPSLSTHLSPSAAALVIAQRLGLSQLHTLRHVEPQTLQAINNFGVSPPTLFRNDELPSKPGFLLVIDGVQDPENFLAAAATPHITIENPPTSDPTSQFLQDLYLQHQALNPLQATYPKLHQGGDLDGCDLDNSGGLERCIDNLATPDGHGSRLPLSQTNLLKTIAKEYGATSPQYKAKSANLASHVARLLANPSSSFELTVLLTPLEEPSKSFFGRSSALPWGDHSAALSRRQVPDLESGHPDVTPEDKNLNDAIPDNPATNEAGDNVQQQPSSPAPAAAQAPTPSPTPSPEPALAPAPAPAAPVEPAQSSNASNPPRGILQSCFESMDDCESRTNQCSGRGSCRAQWSANFGDENRTCYACLCEVERREVAGGGIKTTVWGGPACQKKDISIPFWLLVGASIGLVSAVTFGLSMLYSMGDDPLPSVLSAGVGGSSHRSK